MFIFHPMWKSSSSGKCMAFLECVYCAVVGMFLMLLSIPTRYQYQDNTLQGFPGISALVHFLFSAESGQQFRRRPLKCCSQTQETTCQRGVFVPELSLCHVASSPPRPIRRLVAGQSPFVLVGDVSIVKKNKGQN